MRLKTIGRPYTQNILCYKRCPIVQKLENWKDYQLPTHLNYIVLRARANPGLINCEDLAWPSSETRP